MTALPFKKKSEKQVKRLIAVVLMVLFYIQIWASHIPHFVEGTQLYVVANSGLTLRMEPHKNAPSLGVVEFGSSVLVISQPDSMNYTEKLNWVEGRWLYVDYDGVTGYMFDGYLSDLPLPMYEFERCHLDLDLIYPLESWTEVNLGESTQDVLEAGALRKITDEFVGGEKLIRSQKDDFYTLELTITNIRIMDAYHLLQSMLDSKTSIQLFKEESTFIEDEKGDLYRVKIDLDVPVELRKLKSGNVKITIRSDHYTCGL